MSRQAISAATPSISSRRAAWTVVGLCLLFNVIDGLDAMAMAFTASRVAAQWSLGAAQVGLLLSASLVGMACGSLGIAPMANRHGRRRVLLAGLMLSGVAMVLSFWSQGYCTLLCMRLLTGMGVGAVLVGANVLTHDHAPPRYRNLAIALQSVAFALGATLGGVLAHQLNDSLGWRYVFLAGGCLTLLVGFVGMLWLRESTSRLALTAGRPGLGYRDLFSQGRWPSTCALACVGFLLMFGFYFVMSWTPMLLTHSGFSARHGITGGMLLTVGGMFGALLLGLGANRWGCNRLLCMCLLLNAVMMLLMVTATRIPILAIATGFTAGLLLYAAIAALFVLAPQAFASPERTRGVGVVLATGRLGAIVSPTFAGVLLDAQWRPQDLFTVYAGSQLLAALLIWRSHRATPEAG
ncbi:MFS transporter [Pseudomonas simiae]|mgnify:CR=1 FL=1|jgi:predicted MFS family arabinose efflux permease|uniref:MFS transporter n=1 Tax=Pseudomonas simiae TaxID=321846 RepID=U1UN26_9PSED|nr:MULTISPECIES: MFS transporter [Pseudomonas]AIB35963.1 MFS transporter [Pseudomonas simiae]ERH57718.1 MFS transporter [Pseudomonas simiae]PHX42450.1 MFS transporter [Pseudomonas sp. NZIPFR-PS2]QRR31132.1 MFS transporter [Pseudomonas simiae]